MVIGSGHTTRNRRLRIAHKLGARSTGMRLYWCIRRIRGIVHQLSYFVRVTIETYMIRVQLCNGTHCHRLVDSSYRAGNVFQMQIIRAKTSIINHVK